jgi:single-strand DNA-binding protein
MNTVQLVGRCGNEPRTYQKDDKIFKTSFSLATKESFKRRDGEWDESTQWHNVIVFSDASKRVGKGDLIAVEGRVEYRSYENRDGVKVYITEIVAKKINRLVNNNKAVSGEAVSKKRTVPVRPKATEDIPDDIPEEIDGPEADLPF